MNRFADRDIFMYHHGGGIGHKGRGVSLEASRHHGTRIARGRQARRRGPTLAAQSRTEERASATDHEGSSGEDGEVHAEERPMQLAGPDESRDDRDHREHGAALSDNDSEASGEDSDREYDEADGHDGGDEEVEDGDTWGDEGGDLLPEGEDDYQEYVDDVYAPEGYAKL